VVPRSEIPGGGVGDSKASRKLTKERLCRDPEASCSDRRTALITAVANSNSNSKSSNGQYVLTRKTR